jgi:hypothetical protein
MPETPLDRLAEYVMTPSTVLAGFDLDADIGMSELRSEATLTERLHEHPALRLRRRNDILAVLVTPERWREMLQTIRDLEDLIDGYEQDAVRGIISERASEAQFVPATTSTWNEVTRRFNKRRGSRSSTRKKR